MKRRLSLAALALASFASPAWSQTAIQPGTIVGSFYGLQYFAPSANVIVYTTPPDRAARVTDIILTNYHTTSCKGTLNIGSNLLLLAVTPGQSLVVPFSAGYGMTAGQQIVLNGTDCPGMAMIAMIKGFNFTIP